MKITSLAVVLAIVALTLESARNPCQAGSLTYIFVEGTGAPHPGDFGASITILSPPADATTDWHTVTVTDIQTLTILDSNFFDPSTFSGTITPTIIQDSLESNGLSLFTGLIQGEGAGVKQFVQITPLHSLFQTSGFVVNVVPGSWFVSSSVPEPASAVHAGIAMAIGLALAAFHKRKEARRQRPVGPFDAIQ